MSVCNFFLGASATQKQHLGTITYASFVHGNPPGASWTAVGQEDILPDEVQRPCLMHVFDNYNGYVCIYIYIFIYNDIHHDIQRHVIIYDHVLS